MFGNTCMDFDNAEKPALINVTIRKARKNHVCCECRKPINAGSRYEYTSGLWDGEWEQYKTCMICTAIRDDFFTCDNPPFGDLWEALREMFNDGDDDLDWLTQG